MSAVESIPFLCSRILNLELQDPDPERPKNTDPDPERPTKYESGGSGYGTLLAITGYSPAASIHVAIGGGLGGRGGRSQL